MVIAFHLHPMLVGLSTLNFSSDVFLDVGGVRFAARLLASPSGIGVNGVMACHRTTESDRWLWVGETLWE